jgi:uncharacterized protein (DUF2062 family)
LRNNLQSVALMAMLTLLCAYLAWFLGGPLVATAAVAGAAALYLGNPVASPPLVMSLYRGRAVAHG